jgi:hypothetical protein
MYFDVDVTQAVKDWLNTPGSNNGIALKPADNNISVSFSSKEDTTFSQVPTIVVTLTPGGTGVQSITGGTGISIGGTATIPQVSLINNAVTINKRNRISEPEYAGAARRQWESDC